jgi:hypothetical protein
MNQHLELEQDGNPYLELKSPQKSVILTDKEVSTAWFCLENQLKPQLKKLKDLELEEWELLIDHLREVQYDVAEAQQQNQLH